MVARPGNDPGGGCAQLIYSQLPLLKGLSCRMVAPARVELALFGFQPNALPTELKSQTKTPLLGGG